jgi:general secretion pathway protein D
MAVAIFPSQATTADQRYALAFLDADVAAVASEILGNDLRLPFAVDPAVTAKVSFRADRRMSPEQLLRAFEAALAVSDVVMVRSGGQVVLTPRAKARAAASLRRLSSLSEPIPPGFQMLAVPLAYARPSDAAKAVEASGAGVLVRADDASGVIVLAGTSGELRSTMDALAVQDRSGLSSGYVRVVQLHAAPPRIVAAELQELLLASGVANVTIVPVPRLDQLVISARSAASLAEATSWAARLDTPSHEEKYSLWTYRPQNVSADALALALNQLLAASGGEGGLGGLAPAALPAAAGAPSDRSAAAPPVLQSADPDLRVSVVHETNTLFVMAPESRWTPLKAVLERIDRPPPQILIEATVLEVSLGKEFRTGVDWSVLTDNGRLNIVSTQERSGAVATQPPGFGLTYINNTVKVAVDALAAKTNVHVVSAPKLVAVDNQTATLQVGDQVPTVNQTSQSTSAPGAPLVQTTEYRDTGIILKIKPRINGPDSVMVDFSQEVSSVVPTITSNIDSPTIQQRKFQSQMELTEGRTVAVGGLISSSHTYKDQGVPGFKDIPVLGLLFKGQNDADDRTEIIVLLSAHILRSPAEADRALSEIKGSMPALRAKED